MDESNTATSEIQAWRAKYYQSLEELEQREAHWQRLERLLRGTISRLALALEGADDKLDGPLRRLRADVRGGADEQRLSALSAAVTDALDRLDHSRRMEERSGPCATMLLLLERMSLPRRSAGRAKALRARLKRGGEGRPMPELMDEFAALVSEALAGSDGDEGAGGGLLAKLWRRSPGAEGEHPRLEVRSPDLLEAVIAHLHVHGAEAAPLERIRRRLRSARQDELDRLAGELGVWLDRMLERSRAAGQSHAMSSHEALLQLLERLDLPPELDDEVSSLKRRLESVPDPDEWPQVLEQMADLLRRARNCAQRDKREIERFLTQLTDRLQELDKVFGLIQSHRDESRSGGRQLDARVREQVDDLRTGMRQATDLAQLQGMIEQRLEAIGRHVETFLAAEEARHAAAEERIEALNQRLRSLEQETGQLRSRVRVQQEAALFDSLTGIHNRSAYEERVQQERARWKRFGDPLSLAVIDIDRFKEINDSYGHQAGDKVLTTLAQLLAGRIRSTDFLARYGGEEFVVLLPGADAQSARGVLEDLREAVANCGFHFRGTPVAVTISTGIAEFSGNDTPEQVFARADAALYRAKDEGRNRIVLADPP